jgi:hypothetical protein
VLSKVVTFEAEELDKSGCKVVRRALLQSVHKAVVFDANDVMRVPSVVEVREVTVVRDRLLWRLVWTFLLSVEVKNQQDCTA